MRVHHGVLLISASSVQRSVPRSCVPAFTVTPVIVAAVTLAETITARSNLATERLHMLNSVIHIIKPLAIQQQK